MEERAWTYPAQFHCAQGTEWETRVQCPSYPRGKRRCLARACGMDRGSRLSFRSRAKPRSSAKNRLPQPPEEQLEADTSTPSSTRLKQTSERDEDLENTSPKSSKTERKVQLHESAESTRSLCMCAVNQQIHAGWWQPAPGASPYFWTRSVQVGHFFTTLFTRVWLPASVSEHRARSCATQLGNVRVQWRADRGCCHVSAKSQVKSLDRKSTSVVERELVLAFAESLKFVGRSMRMLRRT